MNRHLNELDYTALIHDWSSRPMRATLLQHLSDCEDCRIRLTELVNLERDTEQTPDMVPPKMTEERFQSLMRLMPEVSKQIVFLYREDDTGVALAARPNQEIRLSSPDSIEAIFHAGDTREPGVDRLGLTVSGGQWTRAAIEVAGRFIEVRPGQAVVLPANFGLGDIPEVIRLELIR